jgi:hypothetical protein
MESTADESSDRAGKPILMARRPQMIFPNSGQCLVSPHLKSNTLKDDGSVAEWPPRIHERPAQDPLAD